MEYATSKIVHRTLHGIFGAMFHENGFARIGSGVCAYLKKLDDDVSFAFEVQCNSFGSADNGSIFCLNGGIGRFCKRADTYGCLYRVLRHVDAPTAESANQLLQRIRSVNPILPHHQLDWQTGRDNWCQYYSANEVEQWGRFLLPHLPELVHRMLCAEQPEHAPRIPVFPDAAR